MLEDPWFECKLHRSKLEGNGWGLHLYVMYDIDIKGELVCGVCKFDSFAGCVTLFLSQDLTKMSYISLGVP